ncbi:ATP-NAD kinase family protein [Paraferrimonas sp. SM1919]|uniref:ATP-NAD kinase family protein n=1 Tax=Paraferrimonas sp. SM1919 TaxID=2662263 RepID=UPI0013D5F2E4|nr:ATP-NAD kinase family protein [Paraferrimonas sp. SM1919]
MQLHNITLGFIVNPYSGVGGALAMKGSDGLRDTIINDNIPLTSPPRVRQALELLLPYKAQIHFKTANDLMGQALLEEYGFHYSVVYQAGKPCSSDDTANAAVTMSEQGCDLLLFAGGDGTARDIAKHLSYSQPVLGIPAGVKIHSGVYGLTPSASAKVVINMIEQGLVSLVEADVMDIDEVAFRQGRVKAKCYSQLQIPSDLKYIQSVKMSGIESEELVLMDIAAHVVEELEDDVRYIMGSGSTVAAVMTELGLDNTLLGVDVIENGELLASDCTSGQLLELFEPNKTKLVITLIGGQGHIFGRGNQQLSPQLIQKLGRENIIIVATKTKLNHLQGKALVCDTSDSELDKQLSGFYPVITGYHDQVMYPVANPE